jgi:DNA replication and repair protein RecF
MAHIEKIRVQHIRTHSLYETSISSGVTAITGANGAGKTSLLEAVYIALQGASFKGSDGDILQRDHSWYRIDIRFDDTSLRTVKFDATRTTGRKQFIVHEKVNYRPLPRYKYPVVLFEPDDLRLLAGSPARRRQFIDRFISQLDPRYGIALRRYERALKQRNALLKQPAVTSDDLFAWNVTLSEHGAYIIEKRLYFIQTLNQKLNDTYRIISRSHDVVSIDYSQEAHNNLQQKLLTSLHGHTDRDKLLGYTTVGPHRDDVLFAFNHTPAMAVASRGEVRSIILALKFLEAHILEDITGEKPIILLDDVFSELDETRQKNLVTEFIGHQIIITSVSAIPIKSSKIVKL